MDKRLEYYGTSKFCLVNQLNQRNCRLKYVFTRTKQDLVAILHRLDSGEDPMTVVTEENGRFENERAPISEGIKQHVETGVASLVEKKVKVATS